MRQAVLTIIVGVALVGIGVWFIYPPAALIALGIITVGFGFLLIEVK